MSENPTDVVVRRGINDVATEIETMDNSLGFYSSVDVSTKEGKVKTLNALQDAEKLQDNLNVPLNVVDIIVQTASVVDDRTGEESWVPRVTLILDDGRAIAGMSNGLFRSLKNIIGVMGHPTTWDGPLSIKVEERGPKGRQYYTVLLVA